MKYEEGEPRVPVAPEERGILSALAYQKDVLEIGTGEGVSTAALQSTADYVATVDPSPWARSRATEYLREFRKAMGFPTRPYSTVTQHASLSEVTKVDFDLAFIDGDHDAEAVRDDFWACLKMVKRGGLIVFHDALAGNVIAGFKLAGIEPFVLKTTYGLGLWQVP